MMRAVLLILTSMAMLEMSACVAATGGGDKPVMVNPTSHDFGKVALHSLLRHDFTITNAGATDSTVTHVSVTGNGYSVSALKGNTVLKAGSSTGFSVFFLCQGLGSQPGSVSVTTTADAAPLEISLTATGVSPAGNGPAIELTPASVNFGNVTVGSSNTQMMRVTNTGSADLIITKISASGGGFSQSGLSIPLTLQAGKDTTFTAAFKPASTGAQSGSIFITSNASSSALTVHLSGSGVNTNPKLVPSAPSVNFGGVALGTNASRTIELTNTGNTNVSISSINSAGSGFSSTGGKNVTLAPNQSIGVDINFDPTAAGTVSGTLTVVSNAPTLQIPLAGQGTGQTVQHTVTLSWDPSASVVTGYNIYRGTVPGGPYNRVNSSVDSGVAYSDQTVSSGLTYFYVVTAINGSNVESAFSNQVSVKIPSP